MFGIQNLLNTEQQWKEETKIIPTKRQSCHSRIWTLPHTNLGHLHVQTHRMSPTGFETGLHVDLGQQQLGHLCRIFSQILWPSMPQKMNSDGKILFWSTSWWESNLSEVCKHGGKLLCDGVEGISRTKRNTKRIYAGTITVGQRDVLAMECQSPTEWSRLIENLPWLAGELEPYFTKYILR